MVWVKDFVNRTWMWRLFEEECLLRQAKNRSSINLNSQGNLLGRFSDRTCPKNIQERRKPQEKYLRESYYHHIKCIAVTFLVAFMWRRPLNSAALATTTHRRSEGMFDGTSTQVATQMINKCKVKRVQEGIYNGKDPP